MVGCVLCERCAVFRVCRKRWDWCHTRSNIPGYVGIKTYQPINSLLFLNHRSRPCTSVIALRKSKVDSPISKSKIIDISWVSVILFICIPSDPTTIPTYHRGRK